MHDEPNFEPTMASKEKERQQVAKDVEAFLLAGGEIELLPPTKISKNNTVNVKKSTE
jgi:hypothetical protein